MAEVTYYVALPFVAADDGIAAGDAYAGTLSQCLGCRLGHVSQKRRSMAWHGPALTKAPKGHRVGPRLNSLGKSPKTR